MSHSHEWVPDIGMHETIQERMNDGLKVLTNFISMIIALPVSIWNSDLFTQAEEAHSPH